MENGIHNQEKREARRKRKTQNQDNKTNWNGDQIRRECNNKKSVRPCNNKVRVKLTLIQKWCTKHGDLLLHFARVDRRRQKSSRSQDLTYLKKVKMTWGWALWASGGSSPQGWPLWPTTPTGPPESYCIASLWTPRCSFTRVEGTLQSYCPKWGALE